MTSPLNIFVFQHSVPDSDLCEHVLRLGRVFLDLPPDICHVDSEDLVVAVHV